MAEIRMDTPEAKRQNMPYYMESLEGKRCKAPAGYYLILDKSAREIRDDAVLIGLYGTTDPNVQDFDLEEVYNFPSGPPITANPALIQTSDGRVWLIDDGKKRWIQTGETLNYYGFDWNQVVKQHNLDYPEGEKIYIY